MEQDSATQTEFLYDKARNFDWGLLSNIGVENEQLDMKLQYDLSQEARKLLGKHGQRPLVHYDYLYLD